MLGFVRKLKGEKLGVLNFKEFINPLGSQGLHIVRNSQDSNTIKQCNQRQMLGFMEKDVLVKAAVLINRNFGVIAKDFTGRWCLT